MKDTIERLKQVLGPGGWLEDDADLSPYLADHQGRFGGSAPLAVRPSTTAEVAEIVRICSAGQVAIVPQGGRTGLVGGATPDRSGAQVVLNLERMNRVRELDADNRTMTVEAGCVLASVQEAAAGAGLLFPLSLGAEGSCQIGGNLSTNAGGTGVLRYGNARDLVLGLEVVVAGGAIWDGLRGLRKDNTGFDLKQWFLGAEGTLGVITAAVLKLFPAHRQTHTALAAVSDPGGALALLRRAGEQGGDTLTTCEYWTGTAMRLVTGHRTEIKDPFAAGHEHYMLIELAAASTALPLRETLEDILGEAFGAGEVLDAVVAESGARAEALWRIRDAIPETLRERGAVIRHDVSVPVSRLPEFLAAGSERVEACLPGAPLAAFGHYGDGNIHFNVAQPESMDSESFQARESDLHRAIYDLVAGLGGSFSAEHGIGIVKRGELARYRPATELALMRAIKSALDPNGIFNPGKVV